MMEDRVVTVSENVDKCKNEYTADLDAALAIAGIGWYNIKYCLVLSLFLVAAMLEPVGYSYVLPSSLCDLNMTDSQRGFIASMPYIGIVLTSYPWGYLVDTQGRKRVIIISSLVAGSFGILAAFMPNLISFAVCKFLASLCIACPAAVPFTFIGELLPYKYRDVILSISTALQIGGVAMVPLLAWAILPLDFRINFGAYYFRSWRLLNIAYSSFFILSALLLICGPESPKYLVSQGNHDEALKVLQVMYARNKGKSPEDYPVKNLTSNYQKQKSSFVASLKTQTLPLLKPSYLKWLALQGFLLFGIFSTGNGLYMWIPDILNKVLTGQVESQTACMVIAQRFNKTTTGECDDSIDNMTFLINSVASIVCAIISTGISTTVKFIGKKTLLVAVYFILGSFCILSNMITKDIVIAVLLSALSMLGLGIGPINAYAVETYPTHLRGMAVSLIMMIGRTGSITGANVAGVLLNAACDATFYVFGGLLYFCGLLSLFLLPSYRVAPSKRPNILEETKL